MARETFLGMRTHHIAIALIAILVAASLAANYYLW
jgi:general stress protein CsbA